MARREKPSGKAMKFFGGGLELTISPELIEEVMREWEAEHPGLWARDMPPTEFSRRCIAKMVATARYDGRMH